MKRQYMDFVPTKSAKKPVSHPKKVVRVVKNTTHKVTKISNTSSGNLASGLGVIEDLSPKVNKIATPAASHFVTKQSVLKTAKAQKIGNKTVVKPVEKTVEKPVQKAEETYKTPKTPFINQDKVEKRPLSKNVYRKREPLPKEDAKAPVAIIDKPEKDSKVSLVITIILTIILGAAAGTVAFLLLPK